MRNDTMCGPQDLVVESVTRVVLDSGRFFWCVVSLPDFSFVSCTLSCPRRMQWSGSQCLCFLMESGTAGFGALKHERILVLYLRHRFPRQAPMVDGVSSRAILKLRVRCADRQGPYWNDCVYLCFAVHRQDDHTLVQETMASQNPTSSQH